MPANPGRRAEPGQPPGTAHPAAAGAAPPPDGYPGLDQQFRTGSLYELRSAVAAHATQAGLPPVGVYDVVLSAHELATNAVRHGAGHGRLRLWADEQWVWCEVHDDGPPDHPTIPAGQQPTENVWPSRRGHGLWLVRQVDSQLTARTGPGGTTVTVRFHRTASANPASRPAG